WIPLVPQSPWKPRRFTLTFHVSPVSLHSGRKEPEVAATYDKTATFTLSASRPSTSLVPDYMPYMADPIRENDLLRYRALARAEHWRHRKRDLPKALALYREMIRARDERARATGERSSDPDTWFQIGEVLRKMGRKVEARAA